MRQLFLSVFVLSTGCAPHFAQLSDTRTGGVPVSYEGNTPPVRLSVARRQMALTDAEDDARQELASIEAQIRELAAQPAPDQGVLARLRELHDLVSARLRSMRQEFGAAASGAARLGVARGTVVNRRGEPRLVNVLDSTGRAVVEPFILEPGAARQIELEPGDAYRFEYTPLGHGVTLVHHQSRPLEDGEAWITGVN